MAGRKEKEISSISNAFNFSWIEQLRYPPILKFLWFLPTNWQEKSARILELVNEEAHSTAMKNLTKVWKTEMGL